MNDELVQVSKKNLLVFALALGIAVRELKKTRKDLIEDEEVISAKLLTFAEDIFDEMTDKQIDEGIQLIVKLPN